MTDEDFEPFFYIGDQPLQISSGPDYTTEIPWWKDEDLLSRDLSDMGPSIADHWTNLMTQKPPEDIIGKISWYAGVFAQLIISRATFPIGLAGFLLEESLQAEGFGAFILWQADAFDVLPGYLQNWKASIDVVRGIRDNIGWLNPVVFGAVTRFCMSSRLQVEAMQDATFRKLLEQEEYKADQLAKIQERENTMMMRLVSQPGDAEIWIDDVNSELLTPETLQFTEDKTYEITLRKYDRQLEDWRIYSFTQDFQKGKRIEKNVALPSGVEGEGDNGDDAPTDVQDLSPDFVYADVSGDLARDGDSFTTVSGEEIRIIGIDAPEKNNPYYQEAKELLQKEIGDKSLRLKIQSHKVMDSYNRVLAEVRNYKGNIALSMLAAGMAQQLWDDDDYYERERYQDAEDTAKARRIGIWSNIP